MSADNERKRDHHFVPQFHLRKWSDADGMVKRWGREKGVLSGGGLATNPVNSIAPLVLTCASLVVISIFAGNLTF